MTVLADSSPLIALAKIKQLDVLRKLFGRIAVTSEVHTEVVVSGAGLPGAHAVAKASWIEVLRIGNQANLTSAQSRLGLGLGELSTLVLAKEIGADLLLLDDLAARKLARREGFRVQGTIGILEAGYARKHLDDLRSTYKALLSAGVYLDISFLDARLKKLQLPPL